MTAEERQRAFDPFFTTHRGSSGLGLSTVYGIVRAHGGSVFIESEAGRGTAVCLSFPTAEPPVLAWRATAEPAPRRLGRALVFDKPVDPEELIAAIRRSPGAPPGARAAG